MKLDRKQVLSVISWNASGFNLYKDDVTDFAGLSDPRNCFAIQAYHFIAYVFTFQSSNYNDTAFVSETLL